jgi:hypothetical protein
VQGILCALEGGTAAMIAIVEHIGVIARWFARLDGNLLTMMLAWLNGLIALENIRLMLFRIHFTTLPYGLFPLVSITFSAAVFVKYNGLI